MRMCGPCMGFGEALKTKSSIFPLLVTCIATLFFGNIRLLDIGKHSRRKGRARELARYLSLSVAALENAL